MRHRAASDQDFEIVIACIPDCRSVGSMAGDDTAIGSGSVGGRIVKTMVTISRCQLGRGIRAVNFAGIVEAGMYQLNMVVPNVGSGDNLLQATVGGMTTPNNVFLTIQRGWPAYVSAMLLFGIVMSIELAPDVEAGLRAEAAARGIDVDALIATALKAYLGEQPTRPLPTPRRVPSRSRSAEMAWASSPDTQFFGKWVVLEGGHVVASGSHPRSSFTRTYGREAFHRHS